jgi:hypothetical protein
MDAVPDHAFLPDVEQRVEQDARTQKLAAAVGRVRASIAGKGPGVELLTDD